MAEETLLRAQGIAPKGPQPRVVDACIRSSCTISLGSFTRAQSSDPTMTRCSTSCDRSVSPSERPFARAAEKKLNRRRTRRCLLGAAELYRRERGAGTAKLATRRSSWASIMSRWGLVSGPGIGADPDSTRRSPPIRKPAAQHGTPSPEARRRNAWKCSCIKARQNKAVPESDRSRCCRCSRPWRDMRAESTALDDGPGRATRQDLARAQGLCRGTAGSSLIGLGAVLTQRICEFIGHLNLGDCRTAGRRPCAGGRAPSGEPGRHTSWRADRRRFRCGRRLTNYLLKAVSVRQ